MLKKCNGFTLLEVMFSFIILSILTTVIIPVYITVYEERKTIREQQQAQLYIADVIQAWLYDDQMIQNRTHITIEGTEYLLETESIGNEIEVCLTWDGRNARNYSICNYGKKEY